MKKVLQIFILFLLFSIIYIISFHTPIRKLIPIYTYFGFYMLVFMSLCLIVLLWILVKKKILKFDIKDCIILTLLCFFVHAFFFGMVPVTMERSISVFMLNEMNKVDHTSKEEIEENFIRKYVYEKDAFDKRLQEQIAIDNIQENTAEYSLSNHGKFLLKCFKWVNKIYHVESNLLDS